jgi:hypothetical protein
MTTDRIADINLRCSQGDVRADDIRWLLSRVAELEVKLAALREYSAIEYGVEAPYGRSQNLTIWRDRAKYGPNLAEQD